MGSELSQRTDHLCIVSMSQRGQSKISSKLPKSDLITDTSLHKNRQKKCVFFIRMKKYVSPLYFIFISSTTIPHISLCSVNFTIIFKYKININIKADCHNFICL